MNKQEKIQHWAEQYLYMKRIVERIDSGEAPAPDSIGQQGMRAHCVEEAWARKRG